MFVEGRTLGTAALNKETSYGINKNQYVDGNEIDEDSVVVSKRSEKRV